MTNLMVIENHMVTENHMVIENLMEKLNHMIIENHMVTENHMVIENLMEKLNHMVMMILTKKLNPMAMISLMEKKNLMPKNMPKLTEKNQSHTTLITVMDTLLVHHVIKLTTIDNDHINTDVCHLIMMMMCILKILMKVTFISHVAKDTLALRSMLTKNMKSLMKQITPITIMAITKSRTDHIFHEMVCS